jgi:hypothetical protein
MMHFSIKFHMPCFNGSLETEIKSTAKSNIHTEFMLLFYILHNIT